MLTPEFQMIFWTILTLEVGAYTLAAGNDFLRYLEVRLEGYAPLPPEEKEEKLGTE